MSNINGPNFYSIDFEREVVMQGKSTSFITINRNDDVLAQDETLYVLFYPNTRTFESVGSFNISQTSAIGGQCDFTSQGFIDSDLSTVNNLAFNNIGPGLYVKNTQDFLPNSEGPVVVEKIEYLNTLSGTVTKVSLAGPTGGSVPFVGATGSLTPKNINVGYYSSVDKENWKFNTVSLGELENLVYSVPATGTALDYTSIINPFDGTSYNPTGGAVNGFTGTGFVSRDLLGFTTSSIISSTPELEKNRGITVRIDYEGANDSHLKLNILIFKYNPSFGPISQVIPVLIPESITGPNNPTSFATELLGLKSGNTSMSPTEFSDNIDYQELHIFGYTDTSVRTSRQTYQNGVNTTNTVYDDRSSYALLKTNPKLSGNVKLTIDSKGELSLNSFDANPQLADSKYKRFPISPESTYQRDLYTFFKDTPEEVVFDLFQEDESYQSTKTSLYQQYDNFYNYGVEQLGSKFYDEDFSFLAPLWMRKVLPDYFVIFRVDHPLSLTTYQNGTSDELFNDVFKNARIVKTFDMRDTSKLGKYVRKIVNDPRFIERPIEVSFDEDASTVWNGIVYKSGTISGKGELLNDFWTMDKPIKEFESFITGGFERNGIISTNLINLEFLFDDPEATTYSINRYFGIYVSEIQLAEFELAASVIGKIPDQSPAPKPGVDGEPYSTRSFVQTNPNGIQLPIEYFHNTTFQNNTSAIPFYQGNVIGKFPLSEMVDDPLRIFYIKDRDDVFKRVIAQSEVDYGFTGTTDYKRVTQLKLFDTQEDISKYGGPVQMISQNDASLLNEGQSQLIINLMDQGNNGFIIADDECLELNVKNYNNTDKNSQYYIQVSSVGGTATSFTFFQDQTITTTAASYVQPAVGENVTITVDSTQSFSENETIFIVTGGYYKVLNIASSTSVTIKNLGSTENAVSGSTINTNALIGSYPTGTSTYLYTALNYKLDLDTNLSLDLGQGYIGSSSNYSLLDSYVITINYPEYNLSVLTGTSGINVLIKEQFKQFRWKMFANSTGLLKGKSWAFPVQDPNGYDYISNFSNEGSVADIAKAIASCINSFANSPTYALAEENRIILKSKLKPLDGNTIEFKRNMISGKSYINNLGFYENGNVKVSTNITFENYTGLTSAETITLNITNPPNISGSTTYFIKVLKTSSGNNIIIRQDVDALNSYTVQNTGTYYSFFTTSNTFANVDIPFSIDVSNVSLGTYQNFVVKLTTDTTVSQLFVGGAQRRRVRAKISRLDGERYYQNNKIELSSTITAGSNSIVLADVKDIYIGAIVVGTGIPNNSYVLEINKNTNIVLINNEASASGTYNLSYGGLSILNNSLFLQQWFQTAKSQYSRLLPWNIQGKYIYSLPYLEEPVFDNKNMISSFNENNAYSIIELDDESQEFYLSDEKRIVAYRMYRPTLGLFSMFPIKEFDFDFFLSDYSYSPILETFRYFLNESIGINEYLELPSDENYVLIPQIIDPSDPAGIKKISAAGSYQFDFEGYNEITNSWNILSTVSVTSTSTENGFIINTYTPFYHYDSFEHPQKYDDGSGYLIRGSGYRNFERSLITNKNADGNLIAVDVKKFRIKYIGGSGLPYLNIQKSDFSKDNDIKEFGGFVGITDILNINDQQEITRLKDEGKYVEAFLRQQLLSEYDRLRENYNKDFATVSRVVPYINKWVQEGTDARDNYYRLNTSRAFGRTNFSPDDSVDFAEPIILSHEFPYLDTLPKDYPENSVGSSRSYMFAKLSDTAFNNKSWYDLISSDNSNDWFLKYFSVGYPTELDYYGNLIPKPREERFTFFTLNPGITRSQTLFRGAKIQVIDIDDSKLELPEIVDSVKYNEYKFAAIQRTIPYNFYETQSPLEIEIVKNEKFKSILLIITRRTHDYRTQSGLQDYVFNYSAIDNLKNNNQQQYNFVSATGTNVSTVGPYGLTGLDYSTQSSYRPRQLFFGGGYLQEGDPKLSGAIDTSQNLPVYNSTTDYLSFFLNSSETYYPFSVSDEVNPFINKYPVNKDATYPFIYDTSSTEIISSSFSFEGFLNKFISTGFSNNTSTYFTYDFTDTRNSSDTILINSLGISSPSKYQYFKNSTTSFGTSEGLNIFTSPYVAYPFDTLETFNIGGGIGFYQNTKNLFTFANIKKNINDANPLVKYFKVTDNGKEETKDFKLTFIAADQIIKKGVLNYAVDQDRPPQYANSSVIGYNIVNTNQNEVVIRHRGYYEPKAMDIISFWVREDESVTNHFEQDFLLSNTRISSVPSYSGIIRNYGINKIADEEILKIPVNSAYKSVYEFIHEIAIDRKNVNVLYSSWDSKYFRKYADLNIYEDIDGYNEMKEFKTFMASKAMSIPKKLDIQTFLSDEISFTLLQPAQSNGLNAQINISRPRLFIELTLQEKLVRFIKENILLFDEFEWVNTQLNLNLTTSELDSLKDTYIRENLLSLYEVESIFLYAVQSDGVPLFVSNLTEAEKTAAGYRIDKDCQVSQLSKFNYTITKTLDTKKSYGYTVSVTFKRV